ncbi:MAG: DUF4331 domain-containing protein [Actinomycetota bacterium]|nr:DUF4331 domain-containing protein [Actinomycetota bacterium]
MTRKLLAGVLVVAAGSAALLAALVRGPGPDAASAASHREAPLISLDPAADITDFFMFRSYQPGNADKVVLVMNVQPGEEPSAGPNYYNFDPSVRYSFGIDNDRDGRKDIALDFRFRNEIRGVVDALGLPLSYVGNVPPGSGSIIPPITKLDGPGSEGLGLRQSYTVTMTSPGPGKSSRSRTLADDLIAVPSNVGPRTMPNYDALAAQGIHELGNGVRVFAGQRQDPFYIDLGAVFDTLNLRALPPIHTALQDAADNLNTFGVDMLSGFNVHTIAIELPASMLTADAKSAATTTQPKLGGYAYTSRPDVRVRSHPRKDKHVVQVQRLANPLVNEVLIATKEKDRWNMLDPEEELDFVDYYLNPRLALALELVFGVPAAKANRTDLVNALLKYSPGDFGHSELLRLDLSVSPRPLAQQRRLTVLAGDNAGWPNGRRPRDDVTDVAIRLVGGPNYIAARAADGVNVDDAPLPNTFPFIAAPADGRDRSPTPHINP